MEQLINFNGVMVLLTTGKSLSEVQSYRDRADVVVSVYPDKLDVLVAKPGMHLSLFGGALWCKA